ncbi:MAG: GGDEF protein [uncultured bacterium]|nr:MAG: GGDEF protein [uncultured bacterium]
MTQHLKTLTNKITKSLLDIEFKKRVSSKSIDTLSNQPKLLNIYLKSSIENTFSELLFRLTHEKYKEIKAHKLWNAILKHKNHLNNKMERDVGILVATLDYLTNVTEEISSPKIMPDQKIEEVTGIATTDGLTGLYSRNIFDFSLEREIIKSIRYNKELSLMIADIDDFKKVNDVYGHQEGDMVLKKLSQIMLGTLRKSDLAARYGGEEFAIIMPETNIERAFLIAERINKNVMEHLKCNAHNITISIGIGTLSKKINSLYELVRITDKALYKAKKLGKNRVVKNC